MFLTVNTNSGPEYGNESLVWTLSTCTRGSPRWIIEIEGSKVFCWWGEEILGGRCKGFGGLWRWQWVAFWTNQCKNVTLWLFDLYMARDWEINCSSGRIQCNKCIACLGKLHFDAFRCWGVQIMEKYYCTFNRGNIAWYDWGREMKTIYLSYWGFFPGTGT